MGRKKKTYEPKKVYLWRYERKFSVLLEVSFNHTDQTVKAFFEDALYEGEYTATSQDDAQDMGHRDSDQYCSQFDAVIKGDHNVICLGEVEE